MALDNKLNITDSTELARMVEKIKIRNSKQEKPFHELILQIVKLD